MLLTWSQSLWHYGGLNMFRDALDLWLKGHVFDSHSFHCQPCRVTTLDKLFAQVCLCHQALSSIIWYRSEGSDTLGLGR